MLEGGTRECSGPGIMSTVSSKFLPEEQQPSVKFLPEHEEHQSSVKFLPEHGEQQPSVKSLHDYEEQQHSVKFLPEHEEHQPSVPQHHRNQVNIMVLVFPWLMFKEIWGWIFFICFLRLF